MDKKQQGLANDYLRNSAHFLWAAEQLNEIAPSSTMEGIFKAENPIYFLLGHSAELVMKAALAQVGVEETKLRHDYRHDLEALLSKYGETQLKTDERFEFSVKAIAENFKKHDHRYARVFSGFNDEDMDRYQKGELSEEEKREYGLVVKSGVNIDDFIKGSSEQIAIVSGFLQKKRAA